MTWLTESLHRHLTLNPFHPRRSRASFAPRRAWAWDTETAPPQETLWSQLAAAQRSPPTSLGKTWKANWPSGAFWSFRGNCSTMCSNSRWLKGTRRMTTNGNDCMFPISLSNNRYETGFKSNKKTLQGPENEEANEGRRGDRCARSQHKILTLTQMIAFMRAWFNCWFRLRFKMH